MLILRKEQIAALSGAKADRFTDEMANHLRSTFPEETAGMDSAALQGYIEKVFDAAKKYNLSSRQDLCRFLNITMLFGMEFENVEARHWMHEYLTDERISDPGKRLKRLYDECISRLETEEKSNTTNVDS